MRASRDSIWPYSRIAWFYEYREADHDDGEKTFLGETGRFNGEDIVEIIVRQEATARFVCTRLFQFFGADEVTAAGEKVIEEMMATYFSSDYRIREMLRTLFHSDFFKSEAAYYAKVKSPVDVVVGTVRMVGTPLQMSDTPLQVQGPSPALSQHTDEILGALGFDGSAIAGLRGRGVV